MNPFSRLVAALPVTLVAATPSALGTVPTFEPPAALTTEIWAAESVQVREGTDANPGVQHPVGFVFDGQDRPIVAWTDSNRSGARDCAGGPGAKTARGRFAP